ncbi:MAG: hypothetical protein AB2L14_32325 [Candidatus Xenobiia bacterium LiM19]
MTQCMNATELHMNDTVSTIDDTVSHVDSLDLKRGLTRFFLRKTVREVEKLVAFTPRGGLPGMNSTGAAETLQKESAVPEMTIQYQGSVKYHEKLVVDLDAEQMSVLKDAFTKA